MSEDDAGKEKEPTPFDGLLKLLADRFAPELLEYLGEVEGITSCEPMGGEVEIMHRLTDRVWRVTQSVAGEELEYLYHLEFESSYTPNIERRLGMYGWGLCEKEGLPVRHLVWYVGDKRPTGWPKDTWRVECAAEMTIGEEVISTIRWWEVWLPGGYQANQFVKEAPPYLLPFAMLMRGVKKPLISKLKNLIMGLELPEEQRQDLLAMVVFFACRHFEVGTIIEVINMDIFEQNPMAKYLVEKGIERGMEQGMEQGMERGMERGMEQAMEQARQGLLVMLQSQAKKRFPRVGKGTLAMMEELSFDSLQQLGEELLDIPDGRAFRQRLLSLQDEPI